MNVNLHASKEKDHGKRCKKTLKLILINFKCKAFKQ